jgi:CheY-like chemotaxis protein
MFRELFALLGREALLAADAEEALRIARESELEVAFIDLTLGETDGCDLARRLRADAAGHALRLVALTGYSDAATRTAAAEAGFDDFLVKPIFAENLAELLRS